MPDIEVPAWRKELDEEIKAKPPETGVPGWRKELDAEESAEGRGLLGDIVSGVARGVAIEAPSLGLDALKATERIARRMVDLPEKGPIGEFATEAKEDIQQYAEESPFLRAKREPGVIAQGVEAATQSMAAGSPGALAGFGVGTLAGGPFAPITGPMGALIGFALSGGVTFGLAEYQSVIDMADKEDIPRSESEPAAIISGLYEGGFEFASNVMTGGIMKVAKPLTTPAKETLKTGIRQLFKTSLKDVMVRGAAVMASETSMEMMTAGFQAEQYKKIGLGDADFWEAAKDAMGPAFVASIIFGGVFAGSASLHRRKIQRNIENGAVKPETRMKAVAEVEEILKGIDPNVAEAWRVNASEAVKDGRDIEIDKSDIINFTAKHRVFRGLAKIGKTPETATDEEFEAVKAEVAEEIRVEEQQDTLRYITAAVARQDIGDETDPDEAQAIGRNKDLPMQDINQAIFEGSAIAEMITTNDLEGMTEFAKQHDIKIPWRVKNPENVGFLIEEYLEEDSLEATRLSSEIANLEETVKRPDTEVAAENLKIKTEELNGLMPAKEEVAEEPVEEEGAPRPEEGRLHLVKREEGKYLLASPVYDLNDKLEGWKDQEGSVYPYFEDDVISPVVEEVAPEAEIEAVPPVEEKPAEPEAAEPTIAKGPIEEVKAKPEDIQPKELYKLGKTIPAVADKPLIDEMVKAKIFKKVDVGLSPKGHVWFRNKEGVGGEIHSVTFKDKENVELGVGYGKMSVAGKFVRGERQDDKILISKHIGDRWAIQHESWHLAEALGLATKTDISVIDNKVKNLLRKGKNEFLPDILKEADVANMTPEGLAEYHTEARAYFMEEALKLREGAAWEGPTKVIMQKIADFVDMAINRFVKPTAKGVVRSFEKGDVLARRPEGVAGVEEAEAQYALSKKDIDKGLTPEQSLKKAVAHIDSLKGPYTKAEEAFRKGSPDVPLRDLKIQRNKARGKLKTAIRQYSKKSKKYEEITGKKAPTSPYTKLTAQLEAEAQTKKEEGRKRAAEAETQFAIQAKTPEFKKWFGKSKVVDEKGEPLVVYHGTGAAEDFDAFDMDEVELGAHFTAAPHVASAVAGTEPEYKEGPPRVIPAILNLENPLRLKDKGKWDDIPEQMVELGVTTKKEVDEFFEEVPRLDAGVREFVSYKGYDGIVYLNRREVLAKGETDVPAVRWAEATAAEDLSDEEFKKKFPMAEDSYIAFRPEQIKSQFNLKPTEDPRIQHAITKEGRASMKKSAEKYPFPTTKTTAKLILAHDKKKPEAKRWYEGSKWLKKVFEDEGLEDTYRGLAILAHTSRNKSVLANMLELVKARTLMKHGGIEGDMGLVKKETFDQVLNADTISQMFKVGESPTGFRTGEVKVKDFADTFVAVFKDNPELRKDLKSVVDVWVSRYFFEGREDPGGKQMMLTPVQHARIQEHMREVEQILTKESGEEWLPDMAQAALWSYVRDEWVRTGKVKRVFEGISFDQTIEQLAKRRLGIDKGAPIDPRHVVSWINQVVKNGGKVWLLDHFSKEKRKVLDPEFQGTGQRGEEWDNQIKQLGEQIRPGVTYHYVKGGNVEDIFKGMVHHRTVIDTTKIYDMNADPDGIRAKHLTGQPIGGPMDQEKVRDSEEEMIAEGYIGTKNEYPDRGYTVVAMFEPTRTFPMARFTMGISPSTNTEQMTILDDIISSQRLKDIFTNKKTKKLNKAAYRKADRELRANRRHLKKINKLMEAGKMDKAYRLVNDHVREIFDHPLIDVLDLSEAQGRYFGTVEPSLHFVIDSGDHDILKGRAGQFLKIYRQNEGIASKYSGFAVVDKNGSVTQAAGFPKTEAESTLIYLPEGLTEDDLAKIDGILGDAGLAGSTYTPSLSTLTIHYQKEYSDAWETKNHKKKVDAADAHRQSVINAYEALTKEFKDGTLSTDSIWFKHDRLLNDWKEDPIGESYDKLIEEGRIRTTNLGIPDRPAAVEGAPRGGKKTLRGEPLYPRYQADRAKQKSKPRDKTDLEVEREKAWAKTGQTPEQYAIQKHADVWHSKMENFLSDSLPGKGPPKQLKTIIQGWAKNGQFKQEELAWSGLNEWLDHQAAAEPTRWTDRKSGFQIVQSEEAAGGAYRVAPIDVNPAYIMFEGDGPYWTLEDAKDAVNQQIRSVKGIKFDPLAIIKGEHDYAKLVPDKKKPITKKELLDYLKANNFRIEEVMLGEEGASDEVPEGMTHEEDLYFNTKSVEAPDDWIEEEEKYHIERFREDIEDEGDDHFLVNREGKVDEAGLEEAAREYAMESWYEMGMSNEVYETETGWSVRYSNDGDNFDIYDNDSFVTTVEGRAGENAQGILYEALQDEGLIIDQDQLDEMGEGSTEHSKYVTGTGENYKELLITMPVAKRKEQYEAGLITHDEYQGGQYTGGHYGKYPGTILHVRFDERIGLDGEKIINIAEIQSDLHQAARKDRNKAVRGVMKKKMKAPLRLSQKEALAQAQRDVPEDYGYGERWRVRQFGKEVKELTQEEAATKNITLSTLKEIAENFTGNTYGKDAPVWVVLDESGESVFWTMVDKERAQKEADMWEAVDIRGEPVNYPYSEPLKFKTKKAVEDAIANMKKEGARTFYDMPFKQTQTWQLLAMKRMVRYAAENDFDMITWDPGVVHVKRYEEAVRKQVDTIEWAKQKAPEKSKEEFLTVMARVLDERNAVVQQMENFEFPEDKEPGRQAQINERLATIETQQTAIEDAMDNIFGTPIMPPYKVAELSEAQADLWGEFSSEVKSTVKANVRRYSDLENEATALMAEFAGNEEYLAESGGASLTQKMKAPGFKELVEKHNELEETLGFLRKDLKGYDNDVQIVGLKDGGKRFDKRIPLEGETTIENRPVTLDWLVGKDMAQKIRESKKFKGEFTGDELTIGGEGMKGFYDRMLPKAVNKFFNKKHWGMAKVKTVDVGSGEVYRVEKSHGTSGVWFRLVSPGGNTIETFWEENIAKKEADLLNKNKGLEALKRQGLPVTEQMKEKALYEGMPQFAIKKGAKQKDTIGAKITDDIAFTPKVMDFGKEEMKDFAAKMYHLFVMKEYPIVRLAKLTGNKVLIEQINKQIRRRRGESGMSEVILTSDNVREALKELEKDGITEYRHITESLGSILEGIKGEAMYRDYERMRVYERDLALAEHRPDIKHVNARKAAKVLGFLKEKYGSTPDGRVLGLSEISDRHREFERQAILMPLKESGWMSQEQYDNIVNRPEAEYYASFLREMEEDESEMVGGGKEVIKKIYGSEKKKLPSVEGTISNLARTVKIVEEQRLNKQILQIREHGEAFEEMITPIPPSFKATPGSWAVYEEGETKRAKRVFKTEGEANMYSAGLPGSQVIKRPGASVPVQYRPQGSMVVAEDGKKTYYEVPKDIQKAVDTHTAAEIHTVMRVLGAPARLLRAGATLSAEFIMRNPVRDQFSALVYSKYGYNMTTDFGRGVFTLMAGSKHGGKVLRGLGISDKVVSRGAALYEEFKASGGEMSYFVSLDRQKVHMKVDQITGYSKGFKWSYANPVELLRTLSEVMEKGTRLGLYTKAKSKGATPGEAMTEARGATLDFGRIGQIRAINQIVAFWNANVQGTVKLRQELLTRPKKSPKSWKYAQTALTRAALGITVPSLILWAINHDDERYKKLPEWQKNFFWIFPIGTDGPILRLPKPFELGLIFGSLPERILDYAVSKDIDEVKSIATAMKDGAMPGMIPTVALPVLEHMTNYSFFRQRRLESQAIQRLPVAMRYTPYTSEAAKTIGGIVNLSPIKLENWIRDWSGSLGYTTVAALDPLLESKKIPEVGKNWYEVTPGIRGFIARDPRGSSSKTTNKFYDYLEKTAQTQAGHKVLLKADQAEAAKYFAKNRIHITSAKRARADATRIAKLRKHQYNIMAHPTMSSERKREEVDKVNRQISVIAERFNEWYKGRK